MSWYRRLLTWLHPDDEDAVFAGAPVVESVPGCVCIVNERVGDCYIESVRVGDVTIQNVRVGDVTIENVHCDC